MIRADNLTKLYRNVEAVSNLSFTIDSGQVVGFLGANGAGKTTTMRMLTTFLRPTSGRAEVAGYDISTSGDQVRERIGYLPENPPLYGELTVVEFLQYCASMRLMKRQDSVVHIDRVLDECDLNDVRNKLCSELSKGYRQRVGLASALLHSPEVLILDEPSSGLDPRQIIHMRDLISAMAGVRTVLLSTHILSEVEEVCGRALIMSQGRLVEDIRLNDLSQRGELEERFLDAITGRAQVGDLRDERS